MAQARRNKKHKTPAWVWLVIGILLGIFFSHVNFLQAYRFIEAALEKTQKSQHKGDRRQAQKEETKFDFYDILAEKSPDYPQKVKSRDQGKVILDSSKESFQSEKYDRDVIPAGHSSAHARTLNQEEVSDLDAPIQTRRPSSEKSSVTQLPPLSRQARKREAESLNQDIEAQLRIQAKLQETKNKTVQEKPSSVVLLKQKKEIEAALHKKNEQKAQIERERERERARAREKERESRALRRQMEDKRALSNKETPPSDPAKRYTLQVATLRSYAEADQLKAQLLMLGFQGIRVQKITKNQNILFRITVGNYSNREAAESARKRLKQNSISGLVVPN